MLNHIELLGWKVKDKVTGFKGTVVHIGLDLFGCVQSLVQPEAIKEKDGIQKVEAQMWFDVSRLEKIGNKPVMEPVPQKGDLKVAGSDPYKPTK